MKETKETRDCRRAKRIPETHQPSLFFRSLPEAEAATKPGEVEFINPSPEEIFIGEVSLRRYLMENDLAWVIKLREELESSDLSGLLCSYDRQGRRAIHPVIVLGLIFYGIMDRHSSLRSLEKLAKRDVGAWWLTGGIQPDHSTVGDFLLRHSEVLTEDFFVSLTRRLCRKLKLSSGTVSGDGTVMEAAASHYRTLKADAAREAAARSPEDEKARQAAEIAAKRASERVCHGRDPKTVRVSPVEPEAVVQPLKSGAVRLSYKPSVLANEDRLILGQRVEASDEAAALGPMLDQHEAIFGVKPCRTLLDGNYHTGGVLGIFAELELDVLCPSGNAEQCLWEKRGAKGRYGKAAFRYDEERDEYVCPAGHRLRYRGRNRDRRGRVIRSYHGAPCAECLQRARCTTAKAGREIGRHEGDEWKEAMAVVMSQEGARRAYRRRRVMVEPVFAELRERQGLTRFHRRGLAGVRLEFALHCLAHNLKRAIRLGEAIGGPYSVGFFVYFFPLSHVFVLGVLSVHVGTAKLSLLVTSLP